MQNTPTTTAEVAERIAAILEETPERLTAGTLCHAGPQSGLRGSYEITPLDPRAKQCAMCLLGLACFVLELNKYTYGLDYPADHLYIQFQRDFAKFMREEELSSDQDTDDVDAVVGYNDRRVQRWGRDAAAQVIAIDLRRFARAGCPSRRVG